MALTADQQAAINQSKAMQTDFLNKSNSYASDYGNYQGQANQAQGDIKNLNNYMSGAGSATNLYNTALASQGAQTGYDQGQMQNAMRNLSSAVGSQSAYNDFANTAASKWGLNAGGLVAANQGVTGSLNNNISAASQSLKNQQDAFSLAQTGANQQAGLGVQQQQTQLAGYKNVYDNAFAQQQLAQSNMQNYAKLAQDQGGLTAQQYQAYAQSNALAIQADAAMKQAQASMLTAQGSYALNTAQAGATNYSTQQAQASNAAKQAQAAKEQAQRQAQAQAAAAKQQQQQPGLLQQFWSPMQNSLNQAGQFLFGG